jgi:hypothetical protein
MKYIKLFEAFASQGNYKAISVFPEEGSDLYVGVFPLKRAEVIYQSLESLSGIKIEITDLPDNHNVVVSKLGGEGLMTGNNADLGWSNPVRPGFDYEFDGSEEHGVAFWAYRDIPKFAFVSGFGGTGIIDAETLLAKLGHSQSGGDLMSAEIEIPGEANKKLVITGPSDTYEEASSFLEEILKALEKQSEDYDKYVEDNYSAVNHDDAMDYFIESESDLHWDKKLAELGYVLLVKEEE